MRLDALTLFGLASVSVMVICYAFERKNPWFIFGMACACVLAGVYGFLAGTWPFGIVEWIWAAIAYGRWWRDRALRAG